MAVSSPLLFLLLLLQQATSELVYESGYTVTTILDGNKLRIPVNPFSLLPAQDGLLLLDSTNSRFYTLSLPISQESAINRFSGDGVGFSDGVPTAAKFDRPRSFAVDSKGNVYVADKNNHAIRKISSTLGVTTIAGGYSQKPGHFDGPGQNASFSDDFDVAYIPKLCSLLITDHGSRLVRQINLKTEDCAHKSPRFEIGMASVSGIGVLCLLLGLVAGFTVRPFLVSNQIFAPHFVNKTWSRSSTSLRIQTLILFSDIRNAVASSAPLILLRRLVGLTISYLSLMFRVCRVEKKNLRPCHVSLVDSDAANNQSMEKSQIFTYQLKDLTSFDGRPAVSESEKSIKQEQQEDGVSNGRHCKIDDMIQASILAFDSQVKLHDPVTESSSLSRRRPTFEEMFT